MTTRIFIFEGAMSHKGIAAASSIAGITKNPSEANVLICRFSNILDNRVLSEFSNVKAIITLTTGTNHIDQAFCRKKGIALYTLHDDYLSLQNITASAEYALILVLMAAREVGETIRKSRNLEKPVFELNSQTREISSTRFGIIGLGRIGMYVGRVLTLISKEVCFFDPYVQETDLNIRRCTLGDVVNVDVLLVSCTYNDETKNMLNDKALGKRRGREPLAIVNIARGPIVECETILGLLRSGKASYYVDTYDSYEEGEIRQLVLESRKNSRLILTPHMAGQARTAVLKADMIGCRLLERLVNFNENHRGMLSES